MKNILKTLAILAGLGVLAVLILFALLPWMDRWGATPAEIAAPLAGDELVPSPRLLYTRAVAINASPEQVYPWIVQLGADKGGMYSYTWFETNLLRCPQTNAERIHAEWQALKVGDKVLMCPDENAPPAYEVALIDSRRAIVMGHQQDGTWSDVWQFVLNRQADGTTRLLLRSRSSLEGFIWDAMRPGEFIMVRGMLLGIKARAESTDLSQLPSPGTRVSMSEFGRDISLSYDPELASSVGTGTVPAVPVSDQVMFAESHPAFAQIRFMEYNQGWSYDLPIILEDRVAQVMVFRISDFPGYGDASLQGFISQSQALAGLLEAGLEQGHCDLPLMDNESALPFLPWTNAKQSFCAQPRPVNFTNGSGIRYLAQYAQDPSPVLDSQVFYTFQGITYDGQFYVSALFPVQTGVFPTQPPECPQCGDPTYDPFAAWQETLTGQLGLLNTKQELEFSPSLQALDELIESIAVAP